MEDIIKSVTEAETRAEEIKLSAEEKSAQILAEAEKRASEILKANEEKLKIYREEQLKAAQIASQEQYKRSIDENSKKAEEYANSLMQKTGIQVSEVVRRVTRGNC